MQEVSAKHNPVRASLGASPASIVRLAVGRALAITARGLVIGLLASLALSRSIATLLYGLTPYDALTYTWVPVVVSAGALLASVGPARRAARRDPLRALRS
jgi:ABC-type antimicrobial peptide transport system permease subunit